MVNKLDEFNEYFNNNYYGLMVYTQLIAKRVNKIELTQHWSQDILHDSYERIHNRLSTYPFEGNLIGYIMVTIRNTIISHYKKLIKTIPVDYNGAIDNIELILKEILEDDKSTIKYQNDIQILTKNIFRYLDTRYTQKELYIFRLYYTTQKSTYKKINKVTEINLTEISRTIKKIKLDLKENFNQWQIINEVF